MVWKNSAQKPLQTEGEINSEGSTPLNYLAPPSGKGVSIDDLMIDGWVEVLEFSFGRDSVLYSRPNQRLIYDETKQKVVYTYPVKDEFKRG